MVTLIPKFYIIIFMLDWDACLLFDISRRGVVRYFNPNFAT